MRRLIAFACEGAELLGTLDSAPGTTGVLIVSGGNEVRCGAHRGMVLLAASLAGDGIPVLRFDRRGVGDSSGENGGYAASGPDIAAALAAFRREQPQLARVIGFGTCDGATALALLDRGCDALVLANPWLGDEDAPPPPAAVRAHYRQRLRDPAAWWRMLAGGPARIASALRVLVRPRSEQPLAAQMAAALAQRPTTLVLATRDRTAQVFADALPAIPALDTVRIDTASHSFAGDGDALASVLRGAVAKLEKSVGASIPSHPIAPADG